MKWLITGGAGYIGSHIADLFIAMGEDVVIYDSLLRGKASRIEYLREKHNQPIPLIVGDIRERDLFADALQKHKPDGIIHSAALKSVSESIELSEEYFQVNFHATQQILELSALSDIHNFIFSSTAAVYGSNGHEAPVKENDEKNPMSPYGSSKLAAENAVESFLGRGGNFGTSLRFFNVVGSAAPELEDNSKENLVPLVLSRIMNGESPLIFGTNYPTRDGTCIRDYVDVRDVAWAHYLASKADGSLPSSMNVGTGHGTSVQEVISYIYELGGYVERPVIRSEPRPGDPSSLFADVSLIESSIGFQAKYSIRESLKSLFL